MGTKEKRTKVVVGVLALAALLGIWTLAKAGDLEPSAPPGPTMKTLDEVEPRIPIHSSDLPLTITEPNSYYLTENINFTGTNNHAILVECDGVTIDLMGFTLAGPNSTAFSGIYISICKNIEIRNGTLTDFAQAIWDEGDNSGHRVINIRAISNSDQGINLNGSGHLIHSCFAKDNGIHGGIYAGKNSILTENTACNNQGNGIHTNDGCTVTGNIASHNGGAGIYTGAVNTVTGNTVQYNSEEGIYADGGATVTGNTVFYNSGHGIFAGEACIVTSNTVPENILCGIYAHEASKVAENLVIGSTADGIRVDEDCMVIDNTCERNGESGDGAGIYVFGTRNHIEGNHVNYNDRGIDVDDVNNLIIRNSAVANTVEYDIVPGNKVGTISTDPTIAGPWDNFDF
jgi:parallel beta-helix repeat protein